MKRLNLERLKKSVALPVATIVLIILVWLNFMERQSQDKQETIQSAIQRNSNLAIALEQSAIRTIHIADAILVLLKTEYLRTGNNTDIGKLLYENAVNKDFIKGAAIIDTNGLITKLNLHFNTPVEINVRDRDFFRFHKAHDTDIVYVNKPIVSRSIGKPVIVISRRVTQNGKFAGVVAVQLEPSTFTSFYAQANLRPHDIISLIAPDGTTYARRTGDIESSGENISKSPLFQHLRKAQDSFYYARDAIRRIPTWFSYRQLKNFPVIATVGTSEQDILQDYFVRLKHNRISTIIISLLIVLFSLFVYLYVKRQKHYQQQIAKQVVTAQERERELIGRELHDNVNQVLTTTKLYLEVALSNKEATESFVAKSMDLIILSINEIRSLSHHLSAPTLRTGSLIDSLSALAEMISGANGLQVNFKPVNFHSSLNIDQSLALYRIAQEQLSNVLKHANANIVEMTIEQKDKTVELSIKDDGVGFNASAKRTGAGITNIISRVKMFNGDVQIRSSLGNGCELQVIMPMSP